MIRCLFAFDELGGGAYSASSEADGDLTFHGGIKGGFGCVERRNFGVLSPVVVCFFFVLCFNDNIEKRYAH